MECNRDEALRAKEIAERKFAEKDIVGAKKFALKAQALFPALDGIGQMIMTLDVYLASEVKICGEKDWYAILSSNVSADEETMKKQYRKLALQLHPDKNKSIGAEGAFKLISEAWSILSDKTKRMLYDQKRIVRGYQQKVYQPNKDSSFSNNTNGLYNFTTSASTKTRAPMPSNTTPAKVDTNYRPPSADTFWTCCTHCKMQYEYLRIYANHNLLCASCHEPFLAKETAGPVNGSGAPTPWPTQQQFSNHSSTSRTTSAPLRSNSAFPNVVTPNVQHGVTPNVQHGVTPNVQHGVTPNVQHGVNIGSFSNQNFQWGVFSRTAGAASATASTTAAAQAANMVHQAYQKARREREEAQAAAKREEAVRRKMNVPKKSFSIHKTADAGSSESLLAKKRTGLDDTREKNVQAFTEQVKASEIGKVNEVPEDFYKFKVSARQNSLGREPSQLDIRKLLIEKTKLTIDKKLEEWHSAAREKNDEKENFKKKSKVDEGDKESIKHGVHKADTEQIDCEKSRSNKKKDTAGKNLPTDQDTDLDTEVNEPMSIDVLDADFHNFDNDRSENSFGNDEIWATYDDEDGMPRFYALIQRVISSKPFKVRMSFLTSKSNTEFGPLSWVASGFVKTCGDFRIGKYEDYGTINSFSHKVRWEKGPRGIIRILPRKGDIWALYRNWSSDWDEHTPDDVIYKYDMVEILEDYQEENGVLVIPLVKVPGYRAVFRRHEDAKEAKRYEKEEMFRFSHQVPSYLLTGQEAENAPKDCHELDPAATPLELLQVITESQTNEGMEGIEHM